MENNNNSTNKEVHKNASNSDLKTSKIQPSTEKMSRLSTSKYTPLSRNTDVDLSIVDQWCEIRTKSIPSRRSFHCLWNINDFIYIFGGINLNSGKNQEFYKINLAQQTPSWMKFSPKGNECIQPLAYCGYASYKDCFYIIGGQDQALRQVNTIYRITPNVNSFKENTKEYDDEKGEIHNITIASEDTIEKLNIPGSPYLEEHCAATCKEGILFFGGFNEGFFQNKLYLYDVDNKKVVVKHTGEGNCPSPRISSSCTMYLNDLYLFGGQDQDGKFLNDMWIYSLDNNTWTQVPEKDHTENYYTYPSGRSGQTMNVYNNQIYIFGGRTNKIMEVNELWTFDPKKKTFDLLQESLIEQHENELVHDKEEKKHQTLKNRASFSLKQSLSTNRSYKLADITKKKKEKITFNETYEEAMYNCFPSLSLMKNSLIYGMDIENNNWKKMMFTLTNKSNQNNFVSIMGNIPTPRDGHTGIIYRNFLVVFGGDRNKFPLNDLYTFIF